MQLAIYGSDDQRDSLCHGQDLISQLERDISNSQSCLEQQEMSYEELKKIHQQVNEECERTKVYFLKVCFAFICHVYLSLLV